MNIGELFSFEPLNSYEVLAGWSGRNNTLRGIIEPPCMIKAQSLIPEAKNILNVSQKESTYYTFTETLVLFNLGTHNLKELSNVVTADNTSAAGILLYGPTRPMLESNVILAANERKIPIIFTASADAAEQVRALYPIVSNLGKNHKLEQFSRYAIYSYLKGMDSITLYSYLTQRVNNPIVVVNHTFRVVFSSFRQADGAKKGIQACSDCTAPDIFEQLHLKQREKWEEQSGLKQSYTDILRLSDDQEIVYLALPLQANPYFYGSVVIIEENDPIGSMDMIYLDAAKEILLQKMIHQRNLDSIENKHKTDFLHDLLYNNFESRDEIINRGKYWEIDLTKPHQLFVLEPSSTEKKINFQELMDKVESIACEALQTTKCQSIIGQIQDQIILIIPENNFKDQTIHKDHAFSLASTLHRKLKAYLPATAFAIGIGRFYHSIMDLARSFQEAKIALELGKTLYDKNHISHFDDLGIVRLLASIDFLQLDDFYRDYLSEVINYDEQNDGNLLETLLLYFKYNGDINAIAQKLYIHPNSLRYRLKKIEELTHTDLRHYEDMLNLFIAGKIAVIKQKAEIS